MNPTIPTDIPDRRSYSVEGVVVRFGKYQKLGLSPDFTGDKITLHPIPDALQPDFIEGQEVRGRFGRVHDSGKCDVNQRVIQVQYFIPDGYQK